MRRLIGILFLVAAAVAGVMAYIGRGPWIDGVDFASATRQSVVLALTVPVCILIGFLLLRTK